MDSFLLHCKSLLTNLPKLKLFRIVLGNEACDLDSAISALTYAFYLNHKTGIPTLPVMNILKQEIPLKTEVVHFLKQNDILLHNLIFRDSLDLSMLKNMSFEITLVDHHILSEYWIPFSSKVKEILDHRPKDPSWMWDSSVQDKIQMVGSCATLVANEIFQNQNVHNKDFQMLAKLLHATILLDTVNFSKSADRARELDVKIIERLETVLNVSPEDLLEYRSKIFNDLTKARTDISKLTPIQILHKDMKKLGQIPISGMPILIEKYLEIAGSHEAILEMCELNSTDIIILMGMQIDGTMVTRDLGIYSRNYAEEINEIICTLKNNKNPDLLLQEKNSRLNGLTLFSQGNTKATRKHIYPILKKIMEKLCLCNVKS
ncbi:exopolyphosphatase PRUNE1-like [Ctenocephalides felis]|uniref:exopolyphosphatase PRUNE1-like n=1 Tax=Ctenocephalides felis TaxID=7515 RepID=UPI000E6E458B|nr:exopolyphosphatase PRUNE1-like [Ctenocephalides felis]